jgi:hypothetical protein
MAWFGSTNIRTNNKMEQDYSFAIGVVVVAVVFLLIL